MDNDACGEITGSDNPESPVSLYVRSSEWRRRPLSSNRNPHLVSETQHACRSRPPATGTVATVATGEVEISIRPVSELVNVPGIDFVGPVPAEVQYLSIFSAAIVAGSQQVDAGQRLIHFLGSEAADAAIRRSGMDPVKS